MFRTANGKWKKTFVDYYKTDDILCTAENKINFINLIVKDAIDNLQ